MRNSMTISLEASEKRGELADVTVRLNKAATDATDPSQEDIGKADSLTREIRSCEVRYRAAVLEEEEADRIASASGDMDAETREFMGLETRSRVSRYVDSAVDGRSIDGVEQEFNQALKLPAGMVPLRMFAPSEAELRMEERRGLEKRTTTNTDTAVTPRGWLDRLFAGTAAEHIGVTMSSVPAGEASFPATTGGGTPAQRGREEAIATGAWTIGVVQLAPTRMGIHYQFAIEDAARVPGLEGALTRDMRSALRERVDLAVFSGDSGANENSADITGFFGSAAAESTISQTNKVKGDKWIEAFAGFLDGKTPRRKTTSARS